MKRKIIGVIAALVLASAGTFALISYVQSAKDRAVAGERLVEVYVLTKDVPADTPIADIKRSLTTEEVPIKVRVDDAVRDAEALDKHLVAAVELQAGEQLLASRLVDSRDLTKSEVPDGLQEVTVSLEPARAVGGGVAVGDTVGVVLSFDPFEVSAAGWVPMIPDAPSSEAAGDDTTDGGGGDDEESDAGDDDGSDDGGDEESDGDDDDDADKTPNMTHLTFHKVLVTGVQFDQNEDDDIATSGVSGDADESGDAADGENGESVERAPSKELLVTLAVSSPQVEQIVFAAEFGHIWLTAENSEADESGTRIVTLSEAYDASEGQQ